LGGREIMAEEEEGMGVCCGQYGIRERVIQGGGVNLDAGKEAAGRRLNHDGGGSMKHRGLGEATSNLARNHPM
jgi:hypothetical protein